MLIVSTNVSEHVAARNNSQSMTYPIKKRQLCSALFLCLITLLLSAGIASAERLPAKARSTVSAGGVNCYAQGEVQTATVAKVVDGDTVHFADGRKVRLIGVNTPELDHKYGRHQAYALAAKTWLQPLQGQRVYYQAGIDKRDRYGRYLYYLFDKDRISLSSQLLSKGLGYRIAIPPNVAYQDCLAQAEALARSQQRGVWQHRLQWQPQAGFVMARVTLTSITRNRGGWWLETNQNLVINIPSYVADLWSTRDVFKLEGRLVEARGWQHPRTKRKPAETLWVWQVKHPNDLLTIEQD